MTAFASSEVIAQLEAAVRESSPERRNRILRCVTDLFASDADRLNSSQIGVFDDVLLRLTEHAESHALCQLASTLADLISAPQQTVRRLAKHKDAAVAAPILLKSKVLSETDLLDLARKGSQQHVLAIAGRSELSEAVTDIVLQHAGKEISRTLARNTGARFSDQGLAKFVAAAERDEMLAEALGMREDVPAATLKHLLSKTTEAVRSRLLKFAPPPLRQRIQAAADAIATQAGATASEPINYAGAVSMVDGLNRTGKLNDSTVNRFAIQHDYAKLGAALAVLSGADVDTIGLIMFDKDPMGLIIASRASRLNWQTTIAIINNRGLPALSKEQAEQSKSFFETLVVSTAQYTIRFEPPVSRTANAAPPGGAPAARAVK